MIRRVGLLVMAVAANGPGSGGDAPTHLREPTAQAIAAAIPFATA